MCADLNVSLSSTSDAPLIVHGMKTLRALWIDESGQGLTEYAILLGAVSMAGVAALKFAGNGLPNSFNNASANLSGSGHLDMALHDVGQ